MVKRDNSHGPRKRRTSLQDGSPITENDSEPLPQAVQSGKKEFDIFGPRLRRVWVFLHFCALFWVIWGFVIRATFHTGTECDMTYSRYQFFPVPVKTKTPYQLYKFMDRGDPRHGNNQHLQEDWCGVGDSENPLSKRHIVLYVPGHWGSHLQARSIGAHGIQMTGARMPHVYMQKAAQAIQTGQWNGQATDESSFIFDVYAADFLEQGSALHGKFLLEQTEFVAEAVSTLAQKCEVSSITILAHSVGGLVARAVPILHPETQPILQNIITLATPHSGFPYALEKGVHDFLSILAENQTSKMLEDTLVVSISGGLRDELIPPEACDVSKVVPHGISVLAPDIIPLQKDKDFGQPRFGMDHKCIVWCHSVLSVARNIIFAVADTDKKGRNASERLEQIQNLLKMNTTLDSSDAYQVRVKKMKSDFQEFNGFFVPWL
mmetsp:Transcript_21281/g.32749  ORF Transcript_21281/g.32749 Transcript_21281/m.32749 type:complete len:434 (-) Transcript_21281:954-2255(-)|eukprot:CAMPEP_0195295718 /NCGR_PEP_ID=MMETSP0707-20130614/17918_1 /TAXON_ID=33640 /ORGANISM="Asterionellopsis glacialis, Strain CCMP134" /LENGTH=433 /DNA_ID=CAMNT_0040357003 /DNA_START=59 /DNA_END=1360 /DNA_ORIENTATION=-